MTPTTPIGKRIKSIRKGLGLTAAQLAGKVGISRSYLTLIEGGKRRFPEKLVKRFSQALELPQEMLFEMYLEQELIKAGVVDRKSWELIKRVLKMTPQEKKSLIYTINGHRKLLV